MRFKNKLRSIAWFICAITPLIMFLFTEKQYSDWWIWLSNGPAIPDFLLEINVLLSLNGCPIPLPIFHFAWILISIELTIVLVEVMTFLPNLVTKLMHRWVKDE